LHKNSKTIHNYYEHIKMAIWLSRKGFFLTEEDVRFGKYILDISCRHNQIPACRYGNCCISTYSIPELKKLEADALLTLSPDGVTITGSG
jgi:coproporphyrinogen III oxidase-like Fe-S oxidoreductase